MQSIDTELFFLLNDRMSNPLFDLVMPVVTDSGPLLVLPFLVYVLVRNRNGKDASGRSLLIVALLSIALSLLTALAADGISSALKQVIARPRPCQVLAGVRLLVECPRSFSLPSGHASSSFAFAIPLFHLLRDILPRTWRWYPIALAALVACSRVFAGVHYPADILAGALLGSGAGLLSCLAWERMLFPARPAP